MAGKWRVRKWPKCRTINVWEVFEPDGSWSGTFESWDEAMEWATSIAARFENMLAVAARRGRHT